MGRRLKEREISKLSSQLRPDFFRFRKLPAITAEVLGSAKDRPDFGSVRKPFRAGPVQSSGYWS
jgi:hypothetical protein